jgi:ketosteroid isomerase-like protein
MISIRMCATGLAFLACGCTGGDGAGGNGSGGAHASRAEVEKGVQESREGYRKAVESSDTTALQRYLTSDLMVHAPGMKLNAQEFRAFAQSFIGAGNKVYAIEFRPLELFTHDSAAYEIGVYTEVLQLPGGAKDTATLNYFLRWKAEDGVWKMDRLVSGYVDAPGKNQGPQG